MKYKEWHFLQQHCTYTETNKCNSLIVELNQVNYSLIVKVYQVKKGSNISTHPRFKNHSDRWFEQCQCNCKSRKLPRAKTLRLIHGILPILTKQIITLSRCLKKYSILSNWRFSLIFIVFTFFTLSHIFFILRFYDFNRKILKALEWKWKAVLLIKFLSQDHFTQMFRNPY